MGTNNFFDIQLDQSIEKLKIEIRFVEIEIAMTDAERIDLEKQVSEFNHKYNVELGPLVEKILLLKMEKAKKAPQKNSNNKEWYSKAEHEYQEFKTQYDDSKSKEIKTLSKEKQEELKSKFKKACKLCHPDKVADEFKGDAQRVFIELKNAYDNNDLPKVSEILESLEKGIFPSGSFSITEKDKLQKYLDKLKTKLRDVKNAIKTLRASESYAIISTISDLPSYFADIRSKLEIELSILGHDG